MQSIHLIKLYLILTNITKLDKWSYSKQHIYKYTYTQTSKQTNIPEILKNKFVVSPKVYTQ